MKKMAILAIRTLAGAFRFTHRRWLTASLMLLLCAMMEPAEAAPSKGWVKVLGIRVKFADSNDAPSLGTIINKIELAKGNFERFSYRELKFSQYDTVEVTLPNNKGSYTGSTLATAAENKAGAQGYDPANYGIVVFFHGSHSSGDKSTVGGSRVWLKGNGGAMMHEFGHSFAWSHQQRMQPDATKNPLSGTVTDPDAWHFMKTGSIDPEPFDKITRGWITDYYSITSDGSYTKRLYSFDDPDISTNLTKRALQVRRKDRGTSTDFWIGFRSRLWENQYVNNPDNNKGDGMNHAMRQGLVFYWDRGDVNDPSDRTGSTVSLDMHPGTSKAFDDQALQPGETYADDVGLVYITNLGRGGDAPNEYIDVRINRGDFSGNAAPSPTWDVPLSCKPGVPLSITVAPNDPDGDEVACMWETSDKLEPYNTSSNVLTKTWDEPGIYTVEVVVSDMKGGTATLSKDVAVSVDGLVSVQWTGGASDGAEWYRSGNWDGSQVNSPITVVAFSSAFTGDNNPSLSGTKDMNQIRLEESLTRDVTMDPITGTLNIYEGGINLSNTTHSLTIGGGGEIVLQSNQVWQVSSQSQLSMAMSVNLNGKVLTLAPRGPISNSGSVYGDGWLDVDIAVDPGALPASAWVSLTGTYSVSNAGTLSVENIGIPYAAGQEFAVFDQALSGGGDWSIEPAQPAPGLYWDNLLAVNGKIAVLDEPPAFTYEKWAADLDVADAAFGDDANGDGVANGLAYLYGATNGMADASGLEPTYNDEIPGELVIIYRRWDGSIGSVEAGVEFATGLRYGGWTLVTNGLSGTTIEVDDDFFGTGVDRVRVGISDEHAPGGALFGRLRAWQ
ncbi:hypothetical protein PDESU_01658 [Pontiella desulfatans]|uniref:PKD domain-containing protein n=1 Tax=Pontiella desulfatans TaxID=2750659 RepID=A0A6C2U064_PONDE|nr:PKD domain-containing protein [Pontiella desulfatans]VGO13104.1 hypothetical protein PDESU_01658 [Pontiella desulfatans]